METISFDNRWRAEIIFAFGLGVWQDRLTFENCEYIVHSVLVGCFKFTYWELL